MYKANSSSIQPSTMRRYLRPVVLATLVLLLLVLLPNAAMAWPNPVPMASAATGTNPRSVFVLGNYAYVTCSSVNVLQVFDISNPVSPSMTGSVSTGTYPASVFVLGNYAYVTNQNGDTFQIFNVTDPASPSLAGSIGTGSRPQSIFVQGSYAYIVNSSSNTLQVFNVSDPAAPSLTASVGTGQSPYSVYVQVNYAYVANMSNSTLQVFNFSESSGSLTLVGSVGTQPQPRSVKVQGNYAYVADFGFLGSSFFQVFDVSNPASPTLAGTVAAEGNPASVDVQGNYAFVAAVNSNTLWVFDVANPAAPTLVGSSATNSGPFSIYIQGDYGYVTNINANTLQVFSLLAKTAPLVTTTVPSNITSTTGDSGGNVTDNGGEPVTARGVCWGTSPNPTISDSHTTDGAGTGVFTSSMMGLTPGTEYHCRAYATNSIGTGYGNDNTFTTLTTPTVTTTPPSDITITTASSGGDVTQDGGDPVTARGVCWSTNANPMISDSHTIDGTGTGTFTSNITGLDDGTLYYVRAYATNSEGTSYGDQVAFRTLDPPMDASYLAEGTNAWGFSTYITLANPYQLVLHAKLTYMDTSGQTAGKGILKSRTLVLPPASQTTVSSMSDIGETDFATKVECIEGRGIGVDRTMFWTGEGAACPGYHSSVASGSLSNTWYMPEGSSNWGFETWTCAFNPNADPANVTLTYNTQDGPVTVHKTIPPHARASWPMVDDVGAADASIQIESDQPLVAERSMYRNDRREGSCSIGATDPTLTFFLAEGATGYGADFVTYVLVQNPGTETNKVSITYNTGSGPVPGPAFEMAPGSRKTVRVNDTLPLNTDFSTTVQGTKSLVAERAMYWDAGSGEAFHASIGLSIPHVFYMLPDGQAGNGFETWTLISNIYQEEVEVRVTYLTPDGKGEPVSFTAKIPPLSRRSFNMADKVPSGRAAAMVESLGEGEPYPILVERSMYMNQKGAGTSTIGSCG